jgi:hypothetical protein
MRRTVVGGCFQPFPTILKSGKKRFFGIIKKLKKLNLDIRIKKIWPGKNQLSLDNCKLNGISRTLLLFWKN